MVEETKITKSRVQLSKLGLGTVSIAGFGQPTSYEEFERVILTAYDLGVRYFDAAPMYGSGRAEMFLGQVIRSHGLRNDVAISTKVGRLLKTKAMSTRENNSLYGANIVWHGQFPFLQEFDYSYDGIMRSAEDSFQRFGMDTFDILHVHDIGRVTHGEADNTEFWRQLDAGGLKALERLRSGGSTKAISIGVNEVEAIMQMAERFDLDYCLVAGRYTLLNHGALHEFLPAMQKRKISVIAAGVFNSGILGGLSAGTRTFDYMDATTEIINRVKRIESICSRYGVNLPEAAVQFVSAHPVVSCVLLGCKNVGEVQQNAAALNNIAPTAMWQELKAAALIPADCPVPVA